MNAQAGNAQAGSEPEPGDSLAARFLASAARVPGRPAFEAGGRTVTFGESARAARRWAQALTDRLGRRPGRVGILADRDAIAYQGILATLVSGAAYVPLNPKFPLARLRTMLRSARLDAVIVDGASFELLARMLADLPVKPLVLAPTCETATLPGSDTTVVTSAELLSASELTGPAPCGPTDVAYLLFTSGSTGEPKGVPIRHGNALHFIDVNQERYGFTERDRFSQASELTFDLSVFDLFGAWNAGACVCALRPIELFAPARFVQRHELSVWFSVPSVVSMLRKKNLLKPASMPTLRWSLFCGEALPSESAEAWQAAAPDSTVENLYGPTEVTVACLVHRWDPVRSPDLCLNGTVPIGRPYPGLDAIVVDEEQHPVPPDMDGELCVGGAQTFAGYWHAPEKSASALFEHELDGRATSFYRTGDRVRRLDNGELVFLGRLDQQIKVFGYRVELGEVEAALRELPGVVEAVALGWPLSGLSAEGVAAFVTGSALEGDTLRAGLEERLPRHALPRVVHVVDVLPLNANGKFDRGALARRLDAAD